MLVLFPANNTKEPIQINLPFNLLRNPAVLHERCPVDRFLNLRSWFVSTSTANTSYALLAAKFTKRLLAQ